MALYLRRRITNCANRLLKMETVSNTIHTINTNSDVCASPFTHRDQLLPELAEPRNFIQVKGLEEWLMKSPPVTTIRVNLLQSSLDHVLKVVKAAFKEQYGAEDEIKFVFHPQFPELLGIEPLSSQVAHPENKEPLKQIVVDVPCGASILRGAHVFAPGVLAMSKLSRAGDLAEVFVDLDGKCKKGTDLFQSPRKLLVGIGRILQPRFKLYGNGVCPNGVAVHMLTNVSRVPCLGDAYLSPETGILQNLPSIAAVRALDPQPGEIVLDMCASPGNKTSHIVELMLDSGTVVALDKTPQKIIPVKRKTQNYCSVKCYSQDSTKCVDVGGRCANFPPPFLPGTFDRVLLDAPCSALGNRPQLSNRMTSNQIRSFPIQQKQLLFAAVEALKTNGTLVYSTCSINQFENESIIAWALNKFPQLELVPTNLHVGGPGWATQGLTEEQRHMVKRFGTPSSSLDLLADSVGFFIAKLRKTDK